MNILAIDYGKKKTGLAYAQTGLDLVLPAGLISEDNNQLKFKKIIEVIKDKNINKLVVGLPLSLNGKETINNKIIKEFISELQILYPIEVVWVDERFTSREADRMVGGGVSRDERAAMVILQSYLNKIN